MSPALSALGLRPSNYATGFPGSPTSRWQARGLLCLSDCISQYLIISHVWGGRVGGRVYGSVSLENPI